MSRQSQSPSRLIALSMAGVLVSALVASMLIWQWPQRTAASAGWRCGDGVSLSLAADDLDLPWDLHGEDGRLPGALDGDPWARNALETWEELLDASAVATIDESATLAGAADGLVVISAGAQGGSADLVAVDPGNGDQEWVLHIERGGFNAFRERGSRQVLGEGYTVLDDRLVVQTSTFPTGHAPYTDVVGFDLLTGEREYCTRSRGLAARPPDGFAELPGAVGERDLSSSLMGDVLVTPVRHEEGLRLEAVGLHSGELLWEIPWQDEHMRGAAGMEDLWVTSTTTANEPIGDPDSAGALRGDALADAPDTPQIVAHDGLDGGELWHYPRPEHDADHSLLVGTVPAAFAGDGGVLVADIGELVPRGEARSDLPERQLSLTMLTRSDDVAWSQPLHPVQVIARQAVDTLGEDVVAMLPDGEVVHLDLDTGASGAAFDVSMYERTPPLAAGFRIGDTWSLDRASELVVYDRASADVLRGPIEEGAIRSSMISVGESHAVISWMHGHTIFALD